MTLIELMAEKGKLNDSDGKPVTAEPIGEPTLVRITPEGFLDFSERVRRHVETIAPLEANAFVIGGERHCDRIYGVVTEVHEKASDYMRSGRWKTKEAIAFPIQFYRI
jgi:hypothetical protein